MSWMRDFNWLITNNILYCIWEDDYIILIIYKDFKLSSWKSSLSLTLKRQLGVSLNIMLYNVS